MADQFLGFDLSTQQLKGEHAPPELPHHSRYSVLTLL